MDDFELELKLDFLNESVDLLSNAEEAFLRLEKERNNEHLMNEIFRLAHNLKGTSRAVGFDQLAEVTHHAEDLILKIKEGIIHPSDSVVSVLLSFKDKITHMISGLKENLNARFEINQTINDIKDALEKKNEPSSLKQEAQQDVQELVEAPKDEVLLVVPQASVFEEEQAIIEQPKEVIPPPAIEHVAPKQQVSPEANEESIRVKLSRIDKINNVIGELVILQTVVAQRRFEFIKDDLSNKSISMMGKLFKEVQEIAMSLRMLPIKTTFQKMTRIVRDTAKALNKEIELSILGEDTEVDKTVLEHIADPLVHIMRNAADHGIESQEKRIEKGKNPKGNIELKAFHEGSNLIIQITDDGGGINPEIIRKKAIEKKIIRESDQLSPNKILDLIFHPGFSTKEQVTEVSGRGVGMDVVKTNIEALGGEVKIASKVDIGSSFKISLPLTLAIIDGLVIRGENEKFVIPLGQVFELTNVNQKDINNYSSGLTLIKIRGDVLPLFYLNSKLGLKIEKTGSQIVILIKTMGYAFGIAVDEIINQQQIVIKKLGEDIKNTKGIMGSAIMGDGRPAFILDLYELFQNDVKQSKAYESIKKM